MYKIMWKPAISNYTPGDNTRWQDTGWGHYPDKDSCYEMIRELQTGCNVYKVAKV